MIHADSLADAEGLRASQVRLLHDDSFRKNDAGMLLGMQLTPLKRACLASCSTPMAFLMQRWREGALGAFRLGFEHGLSCVGCCGALMLLLFAGA